MASKVRVAGVHEDKQELIDRGAHIDQTLKNLKDEDTAIKVVLHNVVKEELQPEEKSLTIEGKLAQAMVSKKTSYKVAFNTETDKAKFITHVMNGDLQDVINVGVSVDVNPARLEKLLDVLNSECFDTALDYKVNAKGYENILEVDKKLGDILKKVVEINDSFAVKYSFKEK